jgi:drug/metabolite transporter (DMT)-like permease
MNAAESRCRGILLGLAGGLVISFDVPFLRLADAEPWNALFVRALCLAAVFALAHQWMNGFSRKALHLPGRDFAIIAAAYGISNVFFTHAVFSTSTANLVFILAFNPMICALLAWMVIGERPSAATWAAIAATTLGVSIIVSGSFGGGTLAGDASALLCTLFLAIALVLSRKSGADMSLAPGLGAAGVALFALPLAWLNYREAESLAWLFANGLIIVPVAAFLLALAPRFIPAPQVAIFYLLETVLAPVWVWIVFREEPSTRTLAGGAIVLAAVLVHSLYEAARENGTARRQAGLQEREAEATIGDHATSNRTD